MSKTKLFVAGALALAGTLAAGLAQARGADVQWSVTIGAPIGVPVYTQPVYQPAPVYVRPAPVYGVPVYHRDARWHDGYRDGRGYREPTRWDRDGDGVPNRHDPVYNPRWDRDGDGIPNRHDRSPWGR
jgi:hypothetical protein